MPLDAEKILSLAQQTLGLQWTAADAAGVAPLLEALRSGLAKLPPRRDLEPASGFSPPSASRRGAPADLAPSVARRTAPADLTQPADAREGR